MPKGLVRSDPNHGGDSYRNGFAVVEPLEINTPITLPHVFGTPIPVADRSLAENLVTWAPSPAHFGNTVAPPAAVTPTFSPVAGEYATAQDVTITSTGSDAIYYTTDGSTPTTGSTLYSGPVHVASSLTLKAIATKTGLANSAVGSAAYVIDAVAKAVVQFKIGNNNGAVSFAAPTTAGNAILVYVQNIQASAVTSITDDGGNTYVLVSGPDASAFDAGAPSNRWVYVCFSAAAASAVTGHGTIGLGQLAIVEISGCTAIDAHHYASIPGATTQDGGVITPTVANDLLISFMGCIDGSGNRVYTVGAGWTLVGQQSENTLFGETTLIQKQDATAAGDYTVTSTSNFNAGGGSEAIALS